MYRTKEVYNYEEVIPIITDLMETRKMTQLELSKLVDISQSQISRYLSGRNKMPVDVLILILRVFRISIYFQKREAQNQEEFIEDMKPKIYNYNL